MIASQETEFLSQRRIFDLEPDEIRELAPWFERRELEAGDLVFGEGERGAQAYVVLKGTLQLERHGWTVMSYGPGDTFGEVALLDNRERTGSVSTLEPTVLAGLRSEVLEKPDFPAKLSSRIFRFLGRQVATYVRSGSSFYNELDVLLIQEGGCAPGHNTVTAYLAEYLERKGRRVFVAQQGFTSLVKGKDEDFGALISKRSAFRALDTIPGVVFSPPLRDQRGAQFRTERFPQFAEEANLGRAAAVVKERKVKAIVAIGGPGTLEGLRALGRQLPDTVQTFFVPVTLDSDIQGTDCIGQYTGVEVGAEKVRCYLADAVTHDRCTILEMLGRIGGYHALHSCIGAGAHLAILPRSTPDLMRLARLVEDRESTVVVVAEGWALEERQRMESKLSAAHFLHQKLLEAGLSPKKKVVCEPFSRDVRGAAPNSMDVTLSQHMARKVVEMLADGKTRVMPTVKSDKIGYLSFDEIRTDNSVDSEAARLGNRLGI